MCPGQVCEPTRGVCVDCVTDADCLDANEASAVAFDCNDAVAGIFSGATELPGDSVDQNCDGLEDCYIDHDGDFHGVPLVVQPARATTAPASRGSAVRMRDKVIRPFR